MPLARLVRVDGWPLATVPRLKLLCSLLLQVQDIRCIPVSYSLSSHPSVTKSKITTLERIPPETRVDLLSNFKHVIDRLCPSAHLVRLPVHTAVILPDLITLSRQSLHFVLHLRVLPLNPLDLEQRLIQVGRRDGLCLPESAL